MKKINLIILFFLSFLKINCADTKSASSESNVRCKSPEFKKPEPKPIAPFLKKLKKEINALAGVYKELFDILVGIRTIQIACEFISYKQYQPKQFRGWDLEKLKEAHATLLLKMEELINKVDQNKLKNVNLLAVRYAKTYTKEIGEFAIKF